MLDPLLHVLYRWGVPPVVIRCVHWTMQRGVLQTWITIQSPVIVMLSVGCSRQFDDLAKFGDRHQIRRSQMFIKLAFEFGCDVIFMSHPITRSLGSKLR